MTRHRFRTYRREVIFERAKMKREDTGFTGKTPKCHGNFLGMIKVPEWLGEWQLPQHGRFSRLLSYQTRDTLLNCLMFFEIGKGESGMQFVHTI